MVACDSQGCVGAIHRHAGREDNAAIDFAVVDERARRCLVGRAIGARDIGSVHLPLILNSVSSRASQRGGDRAENSAPIFLHGFRSRLGVDRDRHTRVRLDDLKLGQREEAIAGSTRALRLEPHKSSADTGRQVVGDVQRRTPGVFPGPDDAPVVIEHRQGEIIVSHAAGIKQILTFLSRKSPKPGMQLSNGFHAPEIHFQPPGIFRHAIQRHRAVAVKTIDVSVDGQFSAATDQLGGGLRGRTSERPVNLVERYCATQRCCGESVASNVQHSTQREGITRTRGGRRFHHQYQIRTVRFERRCGHRRAGERVVTQLSR